MKQKLIAIFVGFILQMAGLVLIHSVWLKQDYINTASLWRSHPDQTARIWAMLLSVLIYVIGAVWIYSLTVKSNSWVAQGIRFGILLAMAVVVYGSLSGWVILPLPHMLVVKWIIGESLLSVVFGLAIAAIFRPKPATA
ncbi:MAG TPA: hypothetical protein VLV89_01045 [Candidatus Acidoferrum sp.]|nr:hypothetical protein [Candidatus Acidoferrum sp.]